MLCGRPAILPVVAAVRLSRLSDSTSNSSRPHTKSQAKDGYSPSALSFPALNGGVCRAIRSSKANKRGRTEKFTDVAIQFCLMVNNLFGLGLRQTSGMVSSLLKQPSRHIPNSKICGLRNISKVIRNGLLILVISKFSYQYDSFKILG